MTVTVSFSSVEAHIADLSVYTQASRTFQRLEAEDILVRRSYSGKKGRGR